MLINKIIFILSLAYLSLSGSELIELDSKTKQLLKTALSQNNSFAISYITATAHRAGDEKNGYEKNTQKAYYYYEKSGKKLATSLYSIGEMYLSGELKPDSNSTNKNTAIYWFKKATNCIDCIDHKIVNPLASTAIGGIYLTEKKIPLAYAYLKKGAELGAAEAQFTLAFLLADKESGIQDFNMADRWINIAYNNPKLTTEKKRIIEEWATTGEHLKEKACSSKKGKQL